jgi:hypothetical protein
MQQYIVMGNGEYRTYVDVLEKNSRGYKVRMKQERRWGFKENVHEISRSLFETCLRTGYFKAVETNEVARYA